SSVREILIEFHANLLVPTIERVVLEPKNRFSHIHLVESFPHPVFLSTPFPNIL
ncbi:MAG: hypothetical protein ACI92E_000646, partial [Oceanicoccus sp.]